MQIQYEENSGSRADTRYPLYFRTLICFAASGTVLNTINWSALLTRDALLPLGMAALLLAYIPIAHAIMRRSDPDNTLPVHRRLCFTDALLIGAAMAVSNFSLLPCLLFLTMVQFNALSQGGGRHLLEHNGAMLLGVAIGYLVDRPPLAINTDLNVSAASLIGAFTYFCVHALYTYKQIILLKGENEQLLGQQRHTNMAIHKMARYLPNRLWRAITQNTDRHIVTERKLLTVFFSDIKDFSQLSEEMDAETLTRLLNNYLTEMSRIVAHYGGTIDKFIGDAVMVVFGDDQSKGPKSDALRCVAMGLAMRKRVKEMMQEWHDQGITHPLQIRMGINTGYCTVGVFGTAERQTYTVLGTHVNLAARLESSADTGEILISYETWSLINQSVMCRDKGHVTVKGFSTPVKVYSVVDLRKNLAVRQNTAQSTKPSLTT